MAEKYGVVPKKFTHEWWEYFWMYYKWHTIVICFVLIVVLVTVYQKVTYPKYDLTLTYAGASIISEESTAFIENKLSPLIEDVNEDGKQLMSFLQLNMSEDASDPQYTMAMKMKLQLALSEDETYIFIMDEPLIKAYGGTEESSGVFAPVQNWLTAELSEDSLYTLHDEAVAVSLKDNKYLTAAGIDASGKYLVMRFYPRKDQKKQIPGYEAAVKLANQILFQN